MHHHCTIHEANSVLRKVLACLPRGYRAGSLTGTVSSYTVTEDGYVALEGMRTLPEVCIPHTQPKGSCDD